MVSQAELILRVSKLWFLVLSQFFREGMGPFKTMSQDHCQNFEQSKIFLYILISWIAIKIVKWVDSIINKLPGVELQFLCFLVRRTRA